jgi:hypothetical protein
MDQPWLTLGPLSARQQVAAAAAAAMWRKAANRRAQNKKWTVQHF